MNINEWLRNHPVYCSRGAPLGDSGQEGRKDYPYMFYLQRIKMIDYDYDLAGTYWGMGREPLFGYMGEDDVLLVRGFVRAKNRAEAKVKINKEYPSARFFR